MSGNYTDVNVRELSGKKSCHGKLRKNLVHLEYLTCVSYVVEMRTEDCVTFMIFHYSVAVDGTGFYDVIIMKYCH